jgi:hypothetical protein
MKRKLWQNPLNQTLLTSAPVIIMILMSGCGDGGGNAPTGQRRSILRGVNALDFHPIDKSASINLNVSQDDALSSFQSFKGEKRVDYTNGQAVKGSKHRLRGHDFPADSSLDLALKALNIFEDARSTSNSAILESDEPIKDRFVCGYHASDINLHGQRSLFGTSQTNYYKNATVATDKPNSILEDVVVEMRAVVKGEDVNCRTENHNARDLLAPYPASPRWEDISKQLPFPTDDEPVIGPLTKEQEEKRQALEEQRKLWEEYFSKVHNADDEARMKLDIPPAFPRISGYPNSPEAQLKSDARAEVEKKRYEAYDAALKAYEEEIRKRQEFLDSNYDLISNKSDGKLDVESELQIHASAKREDRALSVNTDDSAEVNVNAMLRGVTLDGTWFEKVTGSATIRGFDSDAKKWADHKIETTNFAVMVHMTDKTMRQLPVIGKNNLISRDANISEKRDFWREQLSCTGSISIDGKAYSCDQMINWYLNRRIKSP